jgi:hypothetical protein
MALLSSAPSPRSAATPPSSSPVATPALAATSPSLSPAPRSTTSSSLSLAVEPFFPSSRSKAQRWEDASLDGRVSPVPRPSYKDIVASRSVPLEQHPSPPKPRALALVIGCCSISLSKSVGGWQRVDSRRTRCRRLCQPRPARRHFLEDLRGKCFNCLSFGHRAAKCCRPTCCFCCSEPGHRYYECRVGSRRRGGDDDWPGV